jgi:hypothetical protein
MPPPAPNTFVAQPPAPPGNGLAIVGFILALVALVFGSVSSLGAAVAPLSVILGIVFSILALTRSSRQSRPIGLAVAGLIISTLALILLVVRGLGL